MNTSLSRPRQKMLPALNPATASTIPVPSAASTSAMRKEQPRSRLTAGLFLPDMSLQRQKQLQLPVLQQGTANITPALNAASTSATRKARTRSKRTAGLFPLPATNLLKWKPKEQHPLPTATLNTGPARSAESSSQILKERPRLRKQTPLSRLCR